MTTCFLSRIFRDQQARAWKCSVAGAPSDNIACSAGSRDRIQSRNLRLSSLCDHLVNEKNAYQGQAHSPVAVVVAVVALQ